MSAGDAGSVEGLDDLKPSLAFGHTMWNGFLEALIIFCATLSWLSLPCVPWSALSHSS